MQVFLKKEQIEKYLLERLISQNSLALSLKISSGYMSQLLKKDRSPSTKVMKRIMKKFPNASIYDIFEISG